jgi:hypothetical protein
MEVKGVLDGKGTLGERGIQYTQGLEQSLLFNGQLFGDGVVNLVIVVRQIC